MGKFLAVVGVLIVGVGLILWSGIGKNWIGRLPGDIQIQKGNFRFFFLIVTCVLLSLLATLILRIFRRYEPRILNLWQCGFSERGTF